MKNRKGSFFVPFIVVVAFLALITIFIVLSIKYAGVTAGHELGERAFSVYDSYLRGEEALLYLDQSAKYSSVFAMRDIATTRISESTECGIYEDVSLWNTEDKECYPDSSAVKKEYAQLFSKYIDQYLAQYPAATFPLGNYEYVVRKEGERTFIYGNAIQNLEFKIEEPSIKASVEETNVQIFKVKTFNIWPVAGTITTCFGWDYYQGRTRWHEAIDIGVAEGTSVRSIADGKIIRVILGCQVGDRACSGGYGNNVIVEHELENGNKLYSFYAHFASIGVKEGEKVKEGQEIGRIGMTGKTDGPHLHFAIHKKPVPFSSEQDFTEDPFCYLPRTFEGYDDGGCEHKCQ